MVTLVVIRGGQLPLTAITVLLLLVASAVIPVVLYIAHTQQRKKREKARALKLAGVDTLSGTEFEQYIGEILRWQGYKVTFTPHSNDFGVDIVATRHGERLGVQTKRYSRPLDQGPVREVTAGMIKYNCDHSMVVTNNYFTASAKVLARLHDCRLIDRDHLAEWIIDFQTNRR
jgi:restriction system protein